MTKTGSDESIKKRMIVDEEIKPERKGAPSPAIDESLGKAASPRIVSNERASSKHKAELKHKRLRARHPSSKVISHALTRHKRTRICLAVRKPKDPNYILQDWMETYHRKLLRDSSAEMSAALSQLADLDPSSEDVSSKCICDEIDRLLCVLKKVKWHRARTEETLRSFPDADNGHQLSDMKRDCENFLESAMGSVKWATRCPTGLWQSSCCYRGIAELCCSV